MFQSIQQIFTFSSRLDFCRTPGYKMGRCVSIYECDYLYNILTSKSLTQQSIAFLKLSQCDAGRITRNIPHVCCARNDDSLMLNPNAGNGIHDKSYNAPSSAVNSASSDDSIINKSANSLLPRTNECGREKIENRIYSGQVSLCVCRACFGWQMVFVLKWTVNAHLCLGKWKLFLSFSEYRTGWVPLAGASRIPKRWVRGKLWFTETHLTFFFVSSLTATGEMSINCAGSLISHKYVLTAGHCLTGDIIQRVGSL